MRFYVTVIDGFVGVWYEMIMKQISIFIQTNKFYAVAGIMFGVGFGVGFYALSIIARFVFGCY